MGLDESLRQTLLVYQRNEITEQRIYSMLARKHGRVNHRVMQQMAGQELRHYHIWRKHTQQDIGTDWFAVW